MEEDDDDLYEPTASSYANGTNTAAGVRQQIKAEDQDDGEEEGEEIEEDDSDSDIDIITERKPGTKQEQSPQASRLDVPKPDRPTTSERTPSSRAIPIKSETRPSHPPTTTSPAAPIRAGNTYPAISISSLEINGPIPMFDELHKPLTDLDFDADLAAHDKPWRRPGADQSEWFNYGFDEFTWATYCLRQKEMRAGIEGQKQEAKRFEMMFGGGMPGAAGQGMGIGGRDGSQAPAQVGAQGQQAGQMGMGGMSGMPGGGGMPDMNPEMMNAMMQQMMASGMDPSQMDFGTFMQQMQGGGGQGGMPGMGGMGGQGGYGGEQQQQFYGGYGRGGRRGRR